MQYGENRALRERLYPPTSRGRANSAQPSSTTAPLMREILALRQEEARLLGYANFAELSLVPKMADSPAQVIAFLRDLARRARP